MGAPELPELPSWLESLRANELPGTATGPQLNYSTDDSIDKDALPSWMRPESGEYVSADQSPLRQTATPASNAVGSAFTNGIPANSLIDEQALPPWMQEGQAALPQRNIAASSLVQPDALPEWVRNVQQQPATAAPATDQPAAATAPQGLSGNSLIDSQAIPAWMSEQDQGGSGTSPGGQAGLAGSSLIDMNALPNWMREGSQEQRAAWPEVHTAAQFEQPPNTNALTAPSLIDVNALPEWLHSGTGQGPAGIAASASPAPVSPRVESVRVPSRPRVDMGPREQSQVAANVFASMLGVASPTPYFPPQASNVMNTASSPQPQMGNSQLGEGGPGPMTGQPPGQGNYAAGNVANQQPPAPLYPQANPAAITPTGQANPHAKPTKRGFFANLLSWLSR